MQVRKEHSLDTQVMQRPVFLLSAPRTYCAFYMRLLLDTVQKIPGRRGKRDASLLPSKLPIDLAVLQFLMSILSPEPLDCA